MRETISIDEMIAFLNSLIELDLAALDRLFHVRFPATDALANHATVQVDAGDGKPTVGFLGILNGMFGVDMHEYGPITAVFDRRVLVGFRRTDDPDFSKTP